MMFLGNNPLVIQRPTQANFKTPSPIPLRDRPDCVLLSFIPYPFHLSTVTAFSFSSTFVLRPSVFHPHQQRNSTLRNSTLRSGMPSNNPPLRSPAQTAVSLYEHGVAPRSSTFRRCDISAGNWNLYTQIQQSYASTAIVRIRDGFGLVATERIRRGRFVCEYTGEMISPREADRREAALRLRGVPNKYMASSEDNSFVVDATYIGNEGRFANHSCRPNAEMLTLGRKVQFIVLKATRDIEPIQEITVPYG